jgi:hypothetical protein
MSLNKNTNFLTKKKKKKKKKVQPTQMLQQCVLTMPKGIKMMSNYWPNKIKISFFDIFLYLRDRCSNIISYIIKSSPNKNRQYKYHLSNKLNIFIFMEVEIVRHPNIP